MKKIKVLLLVMLMVFSSAGTSFSRSEYYKVSGHSMHPVLQDGDMIEIVSEEYQEGDMVVAVKKDGTKIVKRLIGNRLVSVGNGTSYSIDEVTILGATKYVPMSLAELEAYGFRWESVLAEGEFIVQIAAGENHSLALTNTGVVYAWGDNSSGQLGDGTRDRRHTPVKVHDGAMINEDVDFIEAGGNHSLVLKGGKVYAWGYNANGQLGDNTRSTKDIPIEVHDGVMSNEGVDAIAAGFSHSLAIKGGKVYAWGWNFVGQLGDGDTASGALADKLIPVLVDDGVMTNEGVDAIAAGAFHSLALKGGQVFAWGYNSFGQVGHGNSGPGEIRRTPVLVNDGVMINEKVDFIAAGREHSLALKGGKVYAWGYNQFGQLGDGTINSKNNPVEVHDGVMSNVEVDFIAAGREYSLALKDGKVYAWGENTYGQLGDGTRDRRHTPVKVHDGAMTNEDVDAISTGGYHSLALKGGKVYAWGYNQYGQLGDGNTDNYNPSPVKVIHLEHAETPVIISQPVGTAVVEGDPSPMLTVDAIVNDGASLIYQWYQNTTYSNIGGTKIDGETDKSFSVLTNVPGTYYYYVEVINSNNDLLLSPNTITVKSNPATVIVHLRNAAVPVITSQPTGSTVVEGDPSPTLMVDAMGSDGGSLTYQWYRNATNSNTGGVPIAGATTPIFPVPSNPPGTYYYYVEITNWNNLAAENQKATIVSEVAEVTVLPLVDAAVPVIDIHPKGATVVKGGPSPTLTVSASVYDGGTLTYQWYRNTTNSNTGGTLIPGAESSSYQAPTDQTGTTFYYVEVTNTNDKVTGNKTAIVTSNAAAVNVYLSTRRGNDNDTETGPANEEQPEEPKSEPEPVAYFKDIAGHWAEEDILTSVEKGFIQGYPDGTFRPNHPMTRAEFVAMAVQVLGLEFTSGKIFMDTVNHWGKDFIATAYRYGIIRGYNDNEFGPDDPITREQMVEIIVNAFGLRQKQAGPENRFSDEEQISSWAKEAVEIAINNTIIVGYKDGTFRPKNPATRAEAVSVIVRILRNMELI